MVGKGYMPSSIVENPSFHYLMMHCDCKCVFPSCKQLVNEHLPTILGKAMEMYVLLAIAKCSIITYSFDLWMSRFVLRFFCLVINLIDEEWVLCYVIMALLEA
jgi:hypothetical protein